jgi:hypothetical protein
MGLVANCLGNQMNWPRDETWRCETCGDDGYALEWLMIHGRCRCEKCGTQYQMRGENDEVLTRPFCLLKEEYKAPAKAGWEAWHIPYNEWDDDQWNEAFELAEAKMG